MYDTFFFEQNGKTCHHFVMTYQIWGEHVGKDGWWDKFNMSCHWNDFMEMRGRWGDHESHSHVLRNSWIS